ncbi:MAG TPA: hypothetical protein VLL52_21775, partial [Anaerolineae bacterium]|nr:hypothetical protein [Anaerolineae bacterium]
SAPIFASTTTTNNQTEQTITLPIPEHMPTGLWLLRLTRAAAPALTPNTHQPRGDLFLRPLRITPATNTTLYRNDPLLDAQFLGFDIQQPTYAIIKMQLASRRPLLANYQVALRLTNQHGVVETCPQTPTGSCQLDTAPGYGFLPTTTWSSSQWNFDWLGLPLPPSPSGLGPYPIIYQLYDPATNTVILTRQLGQIHFTPDGPTYQPIPLNQHPPPDLNGTPYNFQDTINYPTQPHLRYLGYNNLTQTATGLALTLHWQTLYPAPTDYTHFVHLVDPQTDTIVAQHDAMPRENTYPTSQWRPNEIVADGLYLDLTNLPSGTYSLRAGLYHTQDKHRLTITPPDNPTLPLPANQLELTTITIP